MIAILESLVRHIQWPRKGRESGGTRPGAHALRVQQHTFAVI